MPNSSPPPHILRNSFRVLVLATAVLYLALVGVSLWARHTSIQNTRALCAFKTDLESRVATGTKFLLDHPQGVPGIPVSVVVVSIRNEQATIHALRFLDC